MNPTFPSSRARRACLALSLGALVLAGCATPAAAPAQPAVALPDAWRFAPARGGDALSADWWRALGSAELDALVQQAQAANPELDAARARLRQARAAVVIAAAPLWPALDASASAQRDIYRADPDNVSASTFRLGLAASYEIDLWGGVRAGRDSATALWRASGFDRDAMVLAVTSEVALAWLQTVSLRERLAIARGIVDNARGVLRVVEARHAAGRATRLELAQQRGLVATQERAAAQLAQRGNESLVALAVLLGRPVGGFDIATTDLSGLRAPGIDASLPATLLTRRPDLAAAESRLAAADADIAVARALMLPRLTLSASAGVQADRPRLMFDHPAYALTAGLLAPVFHAGKLAAGRDLAVARREELLADYRRAIVAAAGDAELAFSAIAGVAAQRAAQDDELAQARQAFALAQRRYQAGAETLLTVLDAQRTLYEAEDSAAQLRVAALQAAVLLYKALGGGWRADAGPPALARR
ncbi:Solvent efflux pump outer membrane protein SrpC [compost metagenome]